MKGHPFEGHKEEFAAIPKQKRSSYNQKMIQTPPMQGKPAKVFKADYPKKEKFKFKEYQLNYHYIEQPQEVKAVQFHFHGMNSHSGSSGYFAKRITENNKINIYALDFMNFGQSEGDERGFIENFQESIQQAESFIKFILEKYNKKPKIFLSGGSFGGTIIFNLSIKKPEQYAGLIMLSPAIKPLRQSQAFLKRVAKVVGFLFPKLKIAQQKFDSGTKYFNPDAVRNDPHNYTGKTIVGSVRTVLNAMQITEQLFEKFCSPYIIFQSGVDKLVDPFGPLELEERCNSKDKTTIYCKNMWHSVFAEEQIQHITEIAIDWLKERV